MSLLTHALAVAPVIFLPWRAEHHKATIVAALIVWLVIVVATGFFPDSPLAVH